MSDWRDDHEYEEDWAAQAPGEGVRVVGGDPNAPPPPEERPPSRRRPVGRFPLPGEDPPAEPSGRGPARRRAPDETPVELPHWTDPPTGQIPRVLGGDRPDDDFEPWAQMGGQGSQGPRFRQDDSDWAAGDWAEGELFKDETMGIGALTEGADEHHEYEGEFPPPSRRGRGRGRGGRDRGDVEQAPAGPGSLEGGAFPGADEGIDSYETYEEESGGGGSAADLAPRVITAVVIAAIAFAAFAAGRGVAMVLVTLMVGVCAFELYAAFQRAGYHPATIIGLLGCVSVVPLAYKVGERGILIAAILVTAFTLFWYMFEVVHARPIVNAALTLLPFAWVGVFGAYAGMFLAYPVLGTGFLGGVVICAVGADIASYFVGRTMGRTPLLPRISPNKTVEGFVGGAIAAVVLGAIVGNSLHPWAFKGIGAGIVLGILVAVTAPLGDLVESMIKRDLGVKDLGTFLPGHGGFLDRFDAILFALPAAFYWALHLFSP